MARRVVCHCCGQVFSSDKPHDPERDTGFGTGDCCRERVIADWVKHSVVRGITTVEAMRARFAPYA